MENCRHCGSEDREFDTEDDSSSENIVQYTYFNLLTHIG